jgi:chitinase
VPHLPYFPFLTPPRSASAEPGPNAPFFNNCHNATQPNANAVSAFKAWTSAGMPASQLVLGLPSYAYISSSKALSLQDRAPQAADPNGNATRPATPMVQVHNDDGGSDGGQVQFRSLFAQGALTRDSSANFVGAGGFERYWDQCSSTPFLRSESAGQVVTYDDTESLGVKASFAKKMSMRGVNLFDVHGDTEDWALTDAIRRSLGL